ncbi:Hypothetical predicted protein, partial [Podarcis lilfordi]
MAFERLNDSNYLLWSERMQAVLQRDRLWQVVSKFPTKPDDEDLDKDQRARATIVLGLEDSQLPYVRESRQLE